MAGRETPRGDARPAGKTRRARPTRGREGVGSPAGADTRGRDGWKERRAPSFRGRHGSPPNAAQKEKQEKLVKVTSRAVCQTVPTGQLRARSEAEGCEESPVGSRHEEPQGQEP